jgi:hypothetical protein
VVTPEGVIVRVGVADLAGTTVPVAIALALGEGVTPAVSAEACWWQLAHIVVLKAAWFAGYGFSLPAP